MKYAWIVVILLLACSSTLACCSKHDLDEVTPAPAPFMLHVFDPGHREILGRAYAKARKDELDENMNWTAPPYFWSKIESVDQHFDWRELDDFVRRDQYAYKVINMGPEFMPDENGKIYMAGDLPSWIENDLSNPQLQTQYSELLSAVMARYQEDIDLWWIGLEVNLGGDGLGWETWKDWLRWQVGTMRTNDPAARIMISFGSWTNCPCDIPPNARHEIDAAHELLDEGIDFDVIAMEYHYGTLQDGGIEELRQALEALKAVGLDIFLWEIFYPSETDKVFEENWDWKNPPQGGYTEAWQAAQWIQTLELAFQDPQIIGLNVHHFQDLTYEMIDPLDWEAGWRCHAGLLYPDGTPKEAYYQLVDTWHALTKP